MLSEGHHSVRHVSGGGLEDGGHNEHGSIFVQRHNAETLVEQENRAHWRGGGQQVLVRDSLWRQGPRVEQLAEEQQRHGSSIVDGHSTALEAQSQVGVRGSHGSRLLEGTREGHLQQGRMAVARNCI